MVPARWLRAFQRILLRWYARHQRPLPWRRTRDPYKILVSEIMLQQTQVDRVIPKYHEWLKKYPTVHTLAQAPLGQVKHTWRPLGYNIRPVRLRTIAKQVVRDHGGKVPDTYDGLMAMDGIGRYTAGAVLSFAFEQDAPILDTNVERLLSRYFGTSPGLVSAPRTARPPQRGGLRSENFSARRQAHPKATPCPRQNSNVRSADTKPGANPQNPLPRGVSARQKLWELAAQVIPPGQGYTINQAMMDFGAMVCTARKPACGSCVMRKQCRSYPINGSAASAARRPSHSTAAPIAS